jgi:glutamate-ammonia-ligase adenylyltransferase
VLQTVTGEGKLFDLDLRLRPEGRQGFTVSRLDAVRRYYAEEGRAETWELQMLTRARPIAGSPETGRRFLELVEPRVYRSPMPEGWTAEIAAMKRRIERERVSAGDRERHLKLGPGGLSDVEFLVQYLQLRHGGAHPEVRVPSTLEALTAMSVTGVLTLAEVEVLTEGYRHLTGLRQSLTLLRPDGPTDLLPDPTTEPRLARALARTAGFETAEALAAHYRQVTLPVRQLLLRWLG